MRTQANTTVRDLDRDELGILMLCAWNNVPRDKARPEWSEHSNASTREAWARVAEAARRATADVTEAMVERYAKAMFHVECEPHKATTGYGDMFGWDDAHPTVRERLTASARALLAALNPPMGR